MYYIIDCPPLIRDDKGAAVSLNNYFELAGIDLWKTGLPLNPEESAYIPNPVLLDFDAYGGYSGYPPELEDLGITLMSKRLGNLLRKAGIDNIELFPATLTNNQTGQTFDYYVYNILGLVAAMNLQNSNYETYRNEIPLADTTTHELAIDESTIHNILLFRLAENLSTIIVHKSIKEVIENAGIDTLTFIKPENYSQI